MDLLSEDKFLRGLHMLSQTEKEDLIHVIYLVHSILLIDFLGLPSEIPLLTSV
jgi:hypothetical protein